MQQQRRKRIGPLGQELAEANESKQKEKVEIAVPYTLGMWRQTQPVEISLVNGKNVLHFRLQDGSRGVTIKEFTLTPVKYDKSGE